MCCSNWVRENPQRRPQQTHSWSTSRLPSPAGTIPAGRRSGYRAKVVIVLLTSRLRRRRASFSAIVGQPSKERARFPGRWCQGATGARSAPLERSPSRWRTWAHPLENAPAPLGPSPGDPRTWAPEPRKFPKEERATNRWAMFANTQQGLLRPNSICFHAWTQTWANEPTPTPILRVVRGSGVRGLWAWDVCGTRVRSFFCQTTSTVTNRLEKGSGGRRVSGSWNATFFHASNWWNSVWDHLARNQSLVNDWWCGEVQDRDQPVLLLPESDPYEKHWYYVSDGNKTYTMLKKNNPFMEGVP